MHPASGPPSAPALVALVALGPEEYHALAAMTQPRYFNTAGPCVPGVHHMLPPERRLTEARVLVEQGLFFILHAPRQTGKTTLLNTLARALEQEGRFTALVVSVE